MRKIAQIFVAFSEKLNYHNTKPWDRTDKDPAFCFEGFILKQLSDAKTDFYNPFYLLNYPFESIFQKCWSEILTICKVLDQPT